MTCDLDCLERLPGPDCDNGVCEPAEASEALMGRGLKRPRPFLIRVQGTTEI